MLIDRLSRLLLVNCAIKCTKDNKLIDKSDVIKRRTTYDVDNVARESNKKLAG